MKNIIVITGQTATGKSDLAVELALRCNGEVISADSRQVYIGLDRGSNKITNAEMKGVPHYGLDLVEPGGRFTVADFQSYAREKILDIVSRNKTPILVGGTGLYIDATMFDHYTFGGKQATPDPSSWSIWGGFAEHDVVWVGLNAPRNVLCENISRRAAASQAAIIDEINHLIDSGVDAQWLQSLGLEYSFGTQLINGMISQDQYISLLSTRTIQYAKRQMTWFKRNQNIQWFDISTTARADIIDLLLN